MYISEKEAAAIGAAAIQIGDIIERGAEQEYWQELHRTLRKLEDKAYRDVWRRKNTAS